MMIDMKSANARKMPSGNDDERMTFMRILKESPEDKEVVLRYLWDKYNKETPEEMQDHYNV